MTDATPTPDPDDVIRRSLQAEAEGVEASDALLDRTLAAAARPAVRASRRLLVAAAVVAAVVTGAAAAIANDGDEHEVDAVEEPTVTTSTTTVDPTSTTSTTTAEDPVPTDGERPTVVALVREDGMLMVVDLETGEQRELYTHGDPNDDSQEGGPYYVDWVELSPDGEWVYFSTCCEPAVGTSYRIPVTGGEPEMINQGAYPEISPDGRFMATSGCQFVYVTSIQSRESTYLETDEFCIGRMAWSPDGRQLAATTSVGPDDEPRVLLFDWDGTVLTVADLGKPDNPGSFVSWLPDGLLNIVSGGPVDDDRSLSQDASYQWILSVDEAGVIREQAGFESGDRTPIEGLPEALVADW